MPTERQGNCIDRKSEYCSLYNTLECKLLSFQR